MYHLYTPLLFLFYTHVWDVAEGRQRVHQAEQAAHETSQPASDLQSLPSQSCDFPALRLLLLSLSLLCGKDGSLYWKITWFSPLTACCMLGKFKTHMRDLAQKNYLHLMDIFAAYCIVMSFWQAQPFIRLPTLLASFPEYCCNIICDWLSFYHALLHRGNSFFFFFFFFF